MKEKEYHLNITDRTEDDGQRSVFINVSVPGDDSQAAVETLLRAASDLVFGCETELYVPDIMEVPDALMPGQSGNLDAGEDTQKDKSDE